MAFSSTLIRKFLNGNRYFAVGTFSNSDGSEGGDIDTSFRVCHTMTLQYIGSTPKPNSPVVNEIMPCDGRAVTIITDANASGMWYAMGEGI